MPTAITRPSAACCTRHICRRNTRICCAVTRRRKRASSASATSAATCIAAGSAVTCRPAIRLRVGPACCIRGSWAGIANTRVCLPARACLTSCRPWRILTQYNVGCLIAMPGAGRPCAMRRFSWRLAMARSLTSAPARLTPRHIALTIGTTSALRVVREIPRLPGGLWRYLVCAGMPLVGGATSEGGNVYQWAAQELGHRRSRA